MVSRLRPNIWGQAGEPGPHLVGPQQGRGVMNAGNPSEKATYLATELLLLCPPYPGVPGRAAAAGS